MNKQIITLQGTSFDAVTGSVIRDVTPAQKSEKMATPIHTAEPVVTTPSKAARQRTVNHAKHHAQQSSRTLMRRAVKVPEPSLKKQAKAQAALEHTHPQHVAVKHSALQLDTQRLRKANETQRHPRVGRFHVPSNTSFIFADVPVRKAPNNQPPVTPPPVQTNKPIDIFENAIENATHFVDVKTQRKHFKKHARRHAFSMTAGTLAILVVAGLALYQNSPSMQLRFAGYKAGVATVTPDFSASGFAYNGSSVQGARVVIGLTSDGTRYQLSQQETNWNGTEMIAQVGSVDSSGQPNYRTLTIGDITVYQLDETEATWIQSGIWYQLTGDKALSENQLGALVKNT